MQMTKKKGIGIALILLVLIAVFALSTGTKDVTVDKVPLDFNLTQNTFYLEEANYQTEMKQTVLPYIEQYKTTNYMPVDNNAKIYYEQYLLPNSNRHVVMAHGFTESVQKYREVIYYFLKNGYSVSLLEHRGHGLSTRLLEDIEKTHIETYDTYISDLQQFITTIVQPSTPDATFFLYGHSMGGAISALYLETYPETFTAAILSSPMMEIDTGNYPVWLAFGLTNFMNLIGKEDAYIFGHGPYEVRTNIADEEGISVPREQYIDNLRAEHSEMNLGGGTFGWLKASLKATKQIEKNASKATTPKLLFQSGLDKLVRPTGQDIFAASAPNTTLILVPNAQHELYMANNQIMIPYFNTIFNFLNQF